MKLYKKDLINLLIGAKRDLDTDMCLRLTAAGLMRQTGNQWNEDWDWNRSELDKMPEKELTDLYLTIS